MGVGFENGGPERGQTAQQSGAQPSGEEMPDWGKLKDDVTGMAGAAVEQGRHFMDTAKTQATDYVDRRKGDAAQSVADIANSLRETSGVFDDRPNIRAFFDSAADGLDQLAGTIRSRSFGEIYTDAEDLMRRRPAAVAAVTLAAGFMLSRFIKSSAEAVYEAEQERRRSQGQGGRGKGQSRSAASA